MFTLPLKVQLLASSRWKISRNQFIAGCDAASSACAADFRRCLQSLENAGHTEDVANIKYIAYNAPQPYKNVFFGALAHFRLSGLHSKGAVYYASVFNRVLLSGEQSLAQDARGPYTTFFHESAHAVDYTVTGGFAHALCFVPGVSYTAKYRHNGRTLQELIHQDVNEQLYAVARAETANLADASIIYRSLRYGEAASHAWQALQGADKKRLGDARIKVIEHFRDQICDGAENEAASDIIGGVTNNRVTGKSYHHPVDGKWYHPRGRYYWYLPFGIETHAVGRELFAEYFSYAMTRNEASLQSTKKNFPRATAAMDVLLEQLAMQKSEKGNDE